VKVPRSEVYKGLARALVAGFSDRPLRGLPAAPLTM
jgi:hypothetical protein